MKSRGIRRPQFEALETRHLLAAVEATSDVMLEEFASSDRVSNPPIVATQSYVSNSLADQTLPSHDQQHSVQRSAGLALESASFAIKSDSFSRDLSEPVLLLASQLLDNDDVDTHTVINSISEVTNATIALDGSLIWIWAEDPLKAVSFEYRINGSETTATVIVTPYVGHSDNVAANAGHQAALLNLVPRIQANFIAIRSGNWSDSSIWLGGEIPSDGARALIHESVSVIFDVATTEPLNWLRIDGEMHWASTVNTRLWVETLVVAPTGSISIGSSDSPIAEDVKAEILIDTSHGPIDQSLDPTLLGRGFISSGKTEIQGAVKTSKALLATDILAGVSRITLSEPIDGWRVGDEILIPGTFTDRSLKVSEYDAADEINARFHDDVVTIAGFSGNEVLLQSPTLYPHLRPEGETFSRSELPLYVVNLTRNVVIRSSDATVPNQQRGHVMIMHNPDADIAYAQFKDLGRSDKRLTVDDPGTNFDGSAGSGTNPRGRYGLHLHRTGVSGYASPKVSLVGNVVWGTPGWGIVQHDSYALLQDNVVFDVVGAGIVAENGNEIGEWVGNIVVKATGDLVNNFDDSAFFRNQRGPRFDLGFTGSGYWVQGGGFGLLMQDNVAASINGAGFDLVHHTDGLKHVEILPVSLIYDPEVRQRYIYAGITEFTPNNVPMRGMRGVEVYNANRGIHTWLHNRDSQDQEGRFTFGINTAHDIESVIRDFKIWGVNNGIQNFYSSLLRFENGLIVGDIEHPVAYVDSQQGNGSKGIGVSHNNGEANRIHFDGLRIEGFEFGFQTFIPYNDFTKDVNSYSVSSLSNAKFANNLRAFVPSSKGYLEVEFSTLFKIENVTPSRVSPDVPLAAFIDGTRGGLSMHFDAGGSFAIDRSSVVGGSGIVAYGWDFDADGVYSDAFGQNVDHTFRVAGAYEVGLKVWDDQGRSAVVRHVITVESTPIENVLGDVEFAGPLRRPAVRGPSWNGLGFEFSNGIASLDPRNGSRDGGLFQTVEDWYRLKGPIEFSFDLRRVATFSRSTLTASVFGINGQFAFERGDTRDVPPNQLDVIAAPEYQELIRVETKPTPSGEWLPLSFSADVGDGYEFYFVRFSFTGHKVQTGDMISIRNPVLKSRELNAGMLPQAITAVSFPFVFSGGEIGKLSTSGLESNSDQAQRRGIGSLEIEQSRAVPSQPFDSAPQVRPELSHLTGSELLQTGLTKSSDLSASWDLALLELQSGI